MSLFCKAPEQNGEVRANWEPANGRRLFRIFFCHFSAPHHSSSQKHFTSKKSVKRVLRVTTYEPDNELALIT